MRDTRRHSIVKTLGLLLIGVLLGACNGPVVSGPTGSAATPVASAVGSAATPIAPASTRSGPTPAGPPPTVLGTVTAGPVCPVERASPDPSCAPRPVSGAVIVITDAATGAEMGRTTTAADGSYAMIVLATGTFVVTALRVNGLMRTPAPVIITLSFPSQHERVDLEYDTGIR